MRVARIRGYPDSGVRSGDQAVHRQRFGFSRGVNTSAVCAACAVQEDAPAGKRYACPQREKRDMGRTIARDPRVDTGTVSAVCIWDTLRANLAFFLGLY